jgi:hypothetical protein
MLISLLLVLLVLSSLPSGLILGCVGALPDRHAASCEGPGQLLMRLQ